MVSLVFLGFFCLLEYSPQGLARIGSPRILLQQVMILAARCTACFEEKSWKRASSENGAWVLQEDMLAKYFSGRLPSGVITNLKGVSCFKKKSLFLISASR